MARIDLNLRPAVAAKAVEWCRERVDDGEHRRQVEPSEDIACLREELRKIEPFSRELSSIVAVVTYVIKHLEEKEEEEEEEEEEEDVAAPLKGKTDGDVVSDLSSVGGVDGDGRDKGNKWLDSSDLWRFGCQTTNGAKEMWRRECSTALVLSRTVGWSNADAKFALDPSRRRGSLDALATNDVVAEQERRQVVGRKRRRCWSNELHRRFVDVLQKLGGPQAATPKHIRELMKVNGLTDNEVKSHLQKYRLRIKKKSTANVWANQLGWRAQFSDHCSTNSNEIGDFEIESRRRAQNH